MLCPDALLERLALLELVVTSGDSDFRALHPQFLPQGSHMTTPLC